MRGRCGGSLCRGASRSTVGLSQTSRSHRPSERRRALHGRTKAICAIIEASEMRPAEFENSRTAASWFANLRRRPIGMAKKGPSSPSKRGAYLALPTRPARLLSRASWCSVHWCSFFSPRSTLDSAALT
jgi:hypothetical protein